MHHTKVDKLARQVSVAACDLKQDTVLHIPVTSNRSEGDGKRKSGSMLSGGMHEECIWREEQAPKKHPEVDYKNRCEMGSDAICQLFCSLLLKVQKCPHF